jgi:hypothetical protein
MNTPQNIRRFKRGDILFREGDKGETIYIVQSGRVSLFHLRGPQKFEIMVATNGQVVGEQNIIGNNIRAISAEASVETTALEFNLTQVKADLEASTNLVKILFKSMHEKLRVLSHDVKSTKLEREQGACPQLLIPKVYSIINFVARHVGKKDGNDTVVPWSTLSIAAVRLFLESAQRMLGAVEILVKLGHAKMIMHKNEEGLEELHLLHFHNLQLVEEFADFYQYHLYKGTRSEMIYVETSALQTAKALVHFAEGLPVDRHGAVRLPFNKLVDDIRTEFGFVLKTTHIEFLEKKGLFMKRQTLDDGVFVSYDISEYRKVLTFWTILHEIDKWNELGKVEMVDKEEKKPAAHEACPSCQTAIAVDMKFCSNCGYKLVA